MSKYYLFDAHYAASADPLLAPLVEVRDTNPITRKVEVGSHIYSRVSNNLRLTSEPTTYGELQTLKQAALAERGGLANTLVSDGFQGANGPNVNRGLRNATALRPSRLGGDPLRSVDSSGYSLGMTPTGVKLTLEAHRVEYAGYDKLTRTVTEMTYAELFSQVTLIEGSFNGAWTNVVSWSSAADMERLITVPVAAQGASPFVLRITFQREATPYFDILNPIYIGSWALSYE